jgi:hypothetical protein
MGTWKGRHNLIITKGLRAKGLNAGVIDGLGGVCPVPLPVPFPLPVPLHVNVNVPVNRNVYV